MSIDHNINVLECLRQPSIWIMAVILSDSFAFAAIVHTRPPATPLAMIITRKLIPGFALLSYMSMGIPLAVLEAAGTPPSMIERP